MKEIWKPIPNYDGFYEASNLGRVRSIERKVKSIRGIMMTFTGRILKQSKMNGYLVVCLRKKGTNGTLLVHQLITMTFLDHKPNGMRVVCDHIDNDKLNNRLENLQIITQRENVVRGKSTKGGSSSFIGVTWHSRDKKWQARISINGKLKHLGSFTYEKAASDAYQLELSKL